MLEVCVGTSSYPVHPPTLLTENSSQECVREPMVGVLKGKECEAKDMLERVAVHLHTTAVTAFWG